MAKVQTNFTAFSAAIGRLRRIGRFDGVGRDRTFGEDLQTAVAQCQIDRYINRQQSPGGQPLAPLKPYTLVEKAMHGFPDTIGVRTGLMLSQRELEGEAEARQYANGNVLEITYGVTDEAKQEMEWFTEGNPPKQEPRPGYALDDEDMPTMDSLANDALSNQLRILNSGNP